MASETAFALLQDAVTQAQVGSGGVVNFAESSTAAGTLIIKQLIVTYKEGNEYLRLDRLIEGLKRFGEVTVFEYRGRGSNEVPSLLADVKVEGSRFQVVYRLA